MSMSVYTQHATKLQSSYSLIIIYFYFITYYMYILHFTFYLYLYLYLYLYPLCIAHPKRDHCAKEKRMLLLKHFPVWQLQFRSVFWEAHLKLLEVDLSHVKTAKPKARVIY